MPIKVACACGAAFAAKDELAGRTVKCPKCQQPLKIPAAGAPAPAAPRPPAKHAPIQRPKASSGASSLNLGDEVGRGMSDAFSDVGLGQQAAGTHLCPGCSAPMAQNAIICIKCGYNAKLGRRMGTVTSGGGDAGGHAGHGAATAELMDRAAQTIADDQAEDQKKTGEGAPWWVYLLGMGALIGFMAMMMLIPQGLGMYISAVLMFMTSIVVLLYAWVRVLILAFLEHPLWGVAILVADLLMLVLIAALWLFGVPYAPQVTNVIAMPPAWTLFVFVNWEKCGGYAALLGIAVAMRWVTMALSFLANLLSNSTEESQLEKSLPPVVQVAGVADKANGSGSTPTPVWDVVPSKQGSWIAWRPSRAASELVLGNFLLCGAAIVWAAHRQPRRTL